MCRKDLHGNSKPHNMRGFFRVQKLTGEGADDYIRDTGSVIGYLKTNAFWSQTGGDGDGTAVRIVTDTVADQVGEGTGQKSAVAGHGHLLHFLFDVQIDGVVL